MSNETARQHDPSGDANAVLDKSDDGNWLGYRKVVGQVASGESVNPQLIASVVRRVGGTRQQFDTDVEVMRSGRMDTIEGGNEGFTKEGGEELSTVADSESAEFTGSAEFATSAESTDFTTSDESAAASASAESTPPSTSVAVRPPSTAVACVVEIVDPKEQEQASRTYSEALGYYYSYVRMVALGIGVADELINDVLAKLGRSRFDFDFAVNDTKLTNSISRIGKSFGDINGGKLDCQSAEWIEKVSAAMDAVASAEAEHKEAKSAASEAKKFLDEKIDELKALKHSKPSPQQTFEFNADYGVASASAGDDGGVSVKATFTSRPVEKTEQIQAEQSDSIHADSVIIPPAPHTESNSEPPSTSTPDSANQATSATVDDEIEDPYLRAAAEEKIWRPYPLSKVAGIPPKKLARLADAGIETVGDLADRTKKHGQFWFSDIKGLGEANAVRIADALSAFHMDKTYMKEFKAAQATNAAKTANAVKAAA